MKVVYEHELCEIQGYNILSQVENFSPISHVTKPPGKYN